MNRLRLARGIATALLALACSSPVALGEAPPPLGTPHALRLPARADIALDNGLRLTMVPLGQVPKATVTMVVRTGSIDEGPKNGLAGFAGEFMKEGAGKRSAAELAAAAADMGGALSIAMGTDESSLSLDVLSEQAPAAIALLASLLREPLLPASELARLRANAARSVAVERSEPSAIAGDAFARAVWGAHPYGRGLPSAADVASYQLKDVRDFLASNLGALRTHVYVSGIYDAPAVEQATRAAFGSWARGPAPTVNVPSGTTRRHVILIDRPGAPQSTIMIGERTIDPSRADYIPLSVATTMLGGGLLSRLDQDLRETRGWTYGVRAHTSPAYRAAKWSVEADVTTAHTTESVAVMLREIRRLARELPPADELKLTQNYRAGTFVIGASSRSGLLAQLAFLDLHGLPQTWLTDYAASVYAVTPAQVSEAFAQHLPDAGMTVVVLGDTRQFERSLRALPELAAPATTWSRVGGRPPTGKAAKAR